LSSIEPWDTRVARSGGCCHDAEVDSTHLTRQQAEKLAANLGRMLRYVNKLCGRMQQLRFPLEDPVCREALRARSAIQGLYTAALAAGQPPVK
jgi:hypothetical protein